MKSFEIFAANKSIDPLNYKLFIDNINYLFCRNLKKKRLHQIQSFYI